MTRQLESVFHERVRRLPEDAALLLVAAADDTGTSRSWAGGRSLGAGAQALDAAERAGLLSVEGSRLDLRHPLVRSAVYRAATPSARRAAHRALADALVGDAAPTAGRASRGAPVGPEEAAVRRSRTRRPRRGAGGPPPPRARRAAELSAEPRARRPLIRAAWLSSLAGRDIRRLLLAEQAAPLADEPSYVRRSPSVQGLAALRSRPADGVRAGRGGVEIAASDPVTRSVLMLSATAGAGSRRPRGPARDREVAAEIELPPGTDVVLRRRSVGSRR